LCEAIRDADALIIRSASQVTARVLKSATQLALVARAGVGTDNIDKKAATERGVIVMNAPSGNSVSTAELALAHIFALARHIPQANASMKAGGWEKKKYGGVQLTGKTVGIIGLGRIGSNLAKRCQACEMRVIGLDPFLSDEQISHLGVTPVDFETIWKTADVISVHVPLTDKTRGLIGEREIAMMKPSTMLINCARGGIMDEEAVAAAVSSGRLAGAAFDVFTEEPPKNSPFVPVENIVMTPHLGASTEEAQVEVAIETAQEIVDYFTSGMIKNSVNMPSMDAALLATMQPWIRLCERMGCFMTGLAAGGVASLILTYAGDLAAKQVWFLTQSVLKGLLDPVLTNEVNFVNAPVMARERGIQVSERREAIPNETGDVISLRIVCASGEEHELRGTVMGGDVRFTSLDGYNFVLEPEGTILVVHNRDVPGVVGLLGTKLGNAGVNIASMRLGRRGKGSQVLTLLSIDGDVPQTVLEDIRNQPQIVDARVIVLPQ
jgi:D-3-phosphoglycerate dehydrogenase